MVRNLCVWFLLITFLVSTFPLKMLLAQKLHSVVKMYQMMLFLFPFLGHQKRKRKQESLGHGHSIPAWDMFWFFAELCEHCNLLMNAGRIKATVFAWGHSMQTLHLDSRCWLLALSVICCHPANSGATTSRHLVARNSAISIKVLKLLHMPWKA